MSSLHRDTRLQAVGMVVLALIAGAAFWIGEGFTAALPMLGILLVYILFITVGRRYSGAVEVMGGIGDERTQELYRRATSFAGSVMSFVLPGWWLVTVAQGEADNTLAALCAIFAAAFLGATVYLSRRS